MKKREINILHTVLMLFVFASPVLVSAFEKTITVYAFLGLFAATVGYRILKDGYIVLTRSSLLLAALSAYSFIQLIWVSDKGSQFALGAMLLSSSVASLLIADYKKKIGSENLQTTALRMAYSASLFYALMVILHQIFIESKFLDCSMCFTSGSSATSAFIAVIGIVVTFRFFGKNKTRSAFYVAIPIMVYVLIMSKSVVGYLFAALVAFAWAITHKHKKVEALLALMVCAVIGVINVINAVAVLVTNAGYFNGAIKGMVSIFGIGSGGYNAIVSVVDKSNSAFMTTFNYLSEALGLAGFAFMALAIVAGIICYRREKKFINLVMLIFSACVIVSSSATLAFTLPLIGMYYACREDGVVLYVNKAVSLVFIIPLAFSILFTTAHVPYGIGKHQCDLGNYEKGGAYYTAGAQMEIFNSHGWEMAYKAYAKSGEADTYPLQKSLIDKAIKFNTKSYAYYRDKAEVYTLEGDYLKALEVWEDIILRHDKEYLYPMYAEKIVDVMANCPLGLEKCEELFARLDTYAKKAADKDIVFEMNNILARSQQYYVNVREGGQAAGDMYFDTEEVTEAEYESSSAES